MALWVISFIDISSDYALHSTGSSYWDVDQLVPEELRAWIQFILTLLIALLALLGVISLLRIKVWSKTSKEIKLFLLLFLASTVWGMLVGIIKGVPVNYVIGDSRNILIYLILFAVVGGMGDKIVDNLYRLFLIGCGIVLVKLFFSLAASLVFGSGLSWRSLFRQSSFFAPMLFVSIGFMVYDQRRTKRLQSTILALLAAFGIFAAQARGFFLGVLFGMLFFIIISLNQKKFYRAMPRLFILMFLILSIGLCAGIILQDDITKSFGYWEGTETFVGGFDFRIRQTNMLLAFFDKNWLVGAGLGAFDPTWEGYEEWLPRPYLVELEYLNLLAKLGLIGISLWIAAFVFLFSGCIRTARRALNMQHKGFIFGLTAGLFALMVESILQTGYSSVLFNLYIVLMLLVLAAVGASQPIAQSYRAPDSHQ